jgi:hypothetical protein
MTVTATWAGTGAAAGGLLTVKVLTGAALKQNGAAIASILVTAPELAITPNATGSWVYGVVGQYIAGTVFSGITAATQAAFSGNVADATHSVAYGTFRSLNTTTATVSTGLLGATAVAEPAGDINIALAEILADPNGPGLAEDASAPASVSVTGAVQTVTTASFTPPAVSLLVVMAVPDGNGTNPYTTTITSSLGLTWTLLVTAGVAGGTELGIWVAQVPTLFSIPPQPGGKAWRRRHRRPQTPVRIVPGFEGWGHQL